MGYVEVSIPIYEGKGTTLVPTNCVCEQIGISSFDVSSLPIPYWIRLEKPLLVLNHFIAFWSTVPKGDI